MENQNINETEWRNMEKRHRRGKIMGGILLVVAGILFLAREFGAEIPYWIFSWKTLLIALGIISAIKHKFRHPAWFILIAIGSAFILNDLYPAMHIKPFLWPVLLILLGLFIIFKPRRKCDPYTKQHWKRWNKYQHRSSHENFFDSGSQDNEDYINSTSVFGGVKKNILSKKFKGGEVVIVFGGADIDLSQADFENTITLEITQVFGGTKLIVPANWEIKSETVTILGSIEDKRSVQPKLNDEAPKVLVIIGTTVFGGIEIKSF